MSQLKVPVYGLMRTADLPETNLVETAACYVEVTKLAIFLHPSTYGSRHIYDRYTGHKTCFLYSNVFAFVFEKLPYFYRLKDWVFLPVQCQTSISIRRIYMFFFFQNYLKV